MQRSHPIRLVLILGLALSACPQIARGAGTLEENLSAYIGPNAEGYLGPLRDGIGGALNSGLFMYPGVPAGGFHLRVDLRGMVVNYKDEDRTFMATTEASFGEPSVTEEVPTVVGSTQSVTVMNPETGAIYTFPGGFDVGSFGLAAPQVTVGSLFGTELLGRYIAYNPNDLEVEKIELFGIGARHSVNSWFDSLPVDIALDVMYQNLKVNDDLVDATALTFGGSVGKSFGIVAAYAGLAYDSIDMESRYISEAGGQEEEVSVDLDKESSFNIGLGATVKLAFLHLNGEYHFAERNSYAVGIGIGN